MSFESIIGFLDYLKIKKNMENILGFLFFKSV
jgi:hypothetical protein